MHFGICRGVTTGMTDTDLPEGLRDPVETVRRGKEILRNGFKFNPKRRQAVSEQLTCTCYDRGKVTTLYCAIHGEKL